MTKNIDSKHRRLRLAALAFVVGIGVFAGACNKSADTGPQPQDDQAYSGPQDGQALLEARVQRLADREAIRALLLQYGHLFDHDDFAGYSKLFTSEGTWSGPFGAGYTTAKGPAAIEKMLVDQMGTPTYDPDKVTGFHLMTNMMIQVDGDRATAQSKWTYFSRSKDNKLVPALAGHYDDVLVRENGEWKFQHREVARDFPWLD